MPTHDPITPNSGGKGEVEVVKTPIQLLEESDRNKTSVEVEDFLKWVASIQTDSRADLLDRIKVLERWRRRLEWLHEGCDKDAEGYEWGVARVKFDEHGKVASFLWTDSDHKDLDAEIERTSK